MELMHIQVGRVVYAKILDDPDCVLDRLGDVLCVSGCYFQFDRVLVAPANDCSFDKLMDYYYMGLEVIQGHGDGARLNVNFENYIKWGQEPRIIKANGQVVRSDLC